MSEDADDDLSELIRDVREHLRWELDLGTRGLPELDASLLRRETGPSDRAELADHAELAPRGAEASSVAARGQEPSVAARGQEPSVAARREEPSVAARRAPPEASPRDAEPPNFAGGEVSEDTRRANAAAASRATQPTSTGGLPVDKRTRLAQLEEGARSCTRCRLHEGRKQAVFARGNPDAVVVFVGEGPGYHEDQQGSPFVGAAGQLLDKMIAAMGLSPDEVYICNVVKCRPPENRTPNPDEAAACGPFLEGQLESVAPRVIVALGRCAAETLGVAQAGQRWRGEWGQHRGVPVMPTYHPAYLLRNPEQKRPVWQDLQAVVAALGRALPTRD